MVTSQPSSRTDKKTSRVDGYRTRAIITTVPRRVAILLLPYFSPTWFALLLPPHEGHRLSPLESPLRLRSQFELVILSLSFSVLFYPYSFSLSLSRALFSSLSRSRSRPTLRPIHSPSSSFLVCAFVLAVSSSRLRSLGQLARNSDRFGHPLRPQLLAHFPSLSFILLLFLFPFCFTVFSLALFLYLSFQLFSSSCFVCSMYMIYMSLAPDHRAVARVLVQPAKVRILIFV